MEGFYRARKEHKRLLVRAFRGATKTTTFATLGAFLLGLYPDGKGLVIRASDPAATETIEVMANIIANNAGWKKVFPHVVPDTSAGWSQSGYCVKRDDVPYEEWARIISNRQDPSFAGFGYGTKALQGYHPSLFLWMDDLIDDENAYSAREQTRLKRVVSGTISPMALVHQPPIVLTGVPWTADDVIAAAAATGEYIVVDTWVWKDKERTIPMWPQMMDAAAIEREKRNDITGGVEFARNFLGDLSVADNRVFSYQSYKSDAISVTWMMQGGCDYASAPDPTKRDAAHSHFALAYLAALPQGGAVVYDGVLEQCSQAEGEMHIRSAQKGFPSWRNAVVEGDGVGAEFAQVLARNPGIRIEPMKTGGTSKAERLVHQLGPWLRLGVVRISDAETPFLNALRRFLNHYPSVSKHDPGWDAADSVYWACRGMPDILVMPATGDTLPSPGGKKKRVDPWANLRNAHV